MKGTTWPSDEKGGKGQVDLGQGAIAEREQGGKVRGLSGVTSVKKEY